MLIIATPKFWDSTPKWKTPIASSLSSSYGTTVLLK
jgi:hypothetical protein